MSAHASLIPELEAVIERGSPAWRAKTLERITAFFLDGAHEFNDDHVRLFDLVFARLIAGIETRARTRLSHRLAPLLNAPIEVVRHLAHDDDIAVAGPILGQSRLLADGDLVDIAETKSQIHLLAVAGRPRIAEAVTDVLVRRGNREVANRLAENRSARLSHDGLVALLARAERDANLAERLARRPSIPLRLLRDLLLKGTDAARRRLLAAATVETRSEIRRVLAKVAEAPGVTAPARSYLAAQRTIEALHAEGRLSAATLVDFARKQQYGETIAALASLCAVPIEVVDRLMGAERPDPVIILCKSAGWGWPTVKAIIGVRPGGETMSSQCLDAAYASFDRLSPTTAQRVLRFWQARSDDGREKIHDGDVP
jgi:uncharacterized protein (DUF2336 family)